MSSSPTALRIFHLLSHDRIKSGGAIQALLLARAQRDAGHEVAIGYNAGRNPDASREDFGPLAAEGFSCVPFPMQRLARFVGRHRFRSYIERLRPDVVHAHRERAMRFAWRALHSMPRPALIVQKGNCYRLDAVTARVFRSPRVDRIVAVAEAVKRVLVLHDGVTPEKVDVVYGSFDPIRFEERLDPAVARHELELGRDTPVVGMLGNLDRKKGHRQFLAAARLVLERRPDVAFVMVGGGDIEAARALAREHGVVDAVRFTGFRPDPERALAAFDVSVTCSRDGEGMTGALRESMALGVPVISTNVAGNPEIVENGRTGLVVPVGDVRSLAAAIVHLLEEPDRARRMGDEGRRRVREVMANPARGRRVEEIYRDVLKWRRPTLESLGLERCIHPDVRVFRDSAETRRDPE